MAARVSSWSPCLAERRPRWGAVFSRVSAEGRLGCPQAGAVVCEAAVSSPARAFVWTEIFISLDKCPGVRLPGRMREIMYV